MHERNQDFGNTPYAPEVSGNSQIVAIVTLLVVIGTVFVFGPRRDPSKVVAGLPCSVLTETEIGAVVATPVRLLPTEGTTCEYVSTASDVETTVLITAHRERMNRLGFHVAVIGDENQQTIKRERARLAALIRPRAVAAR
ncbi:MAG: hypothetical protein ACRENA_10170 [Vulcanimicrobiaceae bacterium]